MGLGSNLAFLNLLNNIRFAVLSTNSQRAEYSDVSLVLFAGDNFGSSLLLLSWLCSLCAKFREILI